MTLTIAAGPDRKAALIRRAQLLALATVVYNTIECVVALAAGGAADSTSLIGFGLDSAVEVSSGLIVLWQFRHHLPESRERTAQKLMAGAFLALALFVGVESVRALVTQQRPEASTIGMVIAALSLAIMPFLSWSQRRTGRELGSGSVVADSKQTLLCTYLSAVLLVGLALNALFGWWWADPIAALVIAAVALKEGREAWRGEGCCASPGWARSEADACGAGCDCCADGVCSA
ncbi:cation diffusion facilitator family transporter [Yimella sp. cx-51]|uniref:cation diffusion facilitator family transporter n=1 Tax=Yimella sp. cx-51 TaxID=2770551 RepID=UPI00165E710E|nr:cation transporter [Yimella sp. cx-51]MBC9956616.1 cation transporter [Yimella sp. cx-51]QTH38285.1 cation transporter [Yimella sp. cx-51]